MVELSDGHPVAIADPDAGNLTSANRFSGLLGADSQSLRQFRNRNRLGSRRVAILIFRTAIFSPF
jgi:hypothetical protein